MICRTNALPSITCWRHKKHSFDKQQHLDRYWNVLPVCGFKSAKFDFNFQSPICCSILFSNKIKNLLLSKTWTSSSLWSLVILDYSTKWNFMAERWFLILSWKLRKFHNPNIFSVQKVPSARWNAKHRTSYIRRLFKWTLLLYFSWSRIQNTMTVCISRKVDWPQKK